MLRHKAIHLGRLLLVEAMLRPVSIMRQRALCLFDDGRAHVRAELPLTGH